MSEREARPIIPPGHRMDANDFFNRLSQYEDHVVPDLYMESDRDMSIVRSKRASTVGNGETAETIIAPGEL